MFSSRMFWLVPLAGSMMLSGVSCRNAQDVPVPDDPLAAEVTPQVKNAYPDWQPTREAPKGNAEYESLFDAPKTGAETTADKPKTETPEDAKEKAMYPILYMDVPSAARIDVTGTGDFLLDGSSLPVEIVKKYLTKIAKTHGIQSMVIVHPEAKAPVAAVNNLLDICRDAQIASVTLAAVEEADGSKKAPAPKHEAASGKWVVDDSAAAQEYTVKKGDTLSSLALKFYKRASLWHFIFDANKNTIKDPAKLIPGKKISIPALKQDDKVSAPVPAKAPAPAKQPAPLKNGTETGGGSDVNAPMKQPAPESVDADAAPALAPVDDEK